MDIVRDQRRSSYRFLDIPTFSAVALLLLGHNVYHECVAFHIASITRVRPMSYSGAAVVMSGGRSVQVCTNVSCKKAGSRGVLDVFRAFAPDGVDVIESGCQGKCGLGPNIRTTAGTPNKEEVYQGVLKPATAAAIVELDFATPVPDAVVDAFNRVLTGDVMYDRKLHDRALAIYDQCLSSGAFDGSSRALSVVKLKQSQAMRMMIRTAQQKNRSSGGGGSGECAASLEEAEAAARESIELWRTNAAAWLHLSDVLADAGRMDEALEALESVKREVPDSKGDAFARAAALAQR